jgi:mono/diheme cytochrome c family protein
MRKLSFILVAAVIALVLATPGSSQAPNTANGNAENGKRLFTKETCYYCHGTAGQGGRDGARIAATALNVQGFIRYVRKPAGAMPAFTEKLLSDQELTDIYAYLQTLPKAKAPKDIPLLDQIRDK